VVGCFYAPGVRGGYTQGMKTNGAALVCLVFGIVTAFAARDFTSAIFPAFMLAMAAGLFISHAIRSKPPA
jgi:hypothetical protein